MWEAAKENSQAAQSQLEPGGMQRAPFKKPGQQHKKDIRAEENYVLWAQILLSVLLFAAVWLFGRMQLPGWEAVKAAVNAVFTTGSTDLWEGERELVRLAQSGWDSFGRTAREVFEGTDTVLTPSTKETAAALHHAPRKAPSGSSLDTYLPQAKWKCPLAGGYLVSSGYGWRTNPLEESQEDFHTGIDMAAAQGTPVYAACAGTVRGAALGSSYGNYVRLLHAGGDETLYAHLQYIFVHEGQTVSQGQMLGTVGQTGDATGPHLHFELLHQGIRYDPSGLPWFCT